MLYVDKTKDKAMRRASTRSGGQWSAMYINLESRAKPLYWEIYDSRSWKKRHSLSTPVCIHCIQFICLPIHYHHNFTSFRVPTDFLSLGSRSFQGFSRSTTFFKDIFYQIVSFTLPSRRVVLSQNYGKAI